MPEGHSADEILNRVIWLAGLCTAFGIGVGHLVASRWYVAAVILVVVGLSVLGMLTLRWGKYAANHVKGIKGEIKVATMLSQLPKDSFWSTSDVVMRGRKDNIDHVVVGETGVWLIETKEWSTYSLRNHQDKFNRNLKDLRGRAAHLKDELVTQGVRIDWVTPVLVLSGEGHMPMISDAHDKVVTLPNLNQLISRGSGQPRLDRENRDLARTVIERRFS